MKTMSTDELTNATEIVRLFRSADPAFKQMQQENAELTAELARMVDENKRLWVLCNSVDERLKSVHDDIFSTLCGSVAGKPDDEPEALNKSGNTRRNNTVSSDPKVALFGSLTRSPQILSALERTARQNGFVGAVNTLRKRLQNLERDGSVIGEGENPRTWRLK